jgi:hypothetical protein
LGGLSEYALGLQLETRKHESRRATYHDVNFLLNLGKHRLVWNCDTFKDMVCCSVHGRRSPDEVDICESAYHSNVTKVDGGGNERRTLAKVSLYLDSIAVDGYFLTWDQGTLVAGLLVGHIVTVLCLLCGNHSQ